LQENDEIIKKFSSESKKWKRDFNLAQFWSIDLEKQIADLADTLKKFQDDKKIAEDALENSKKDLEKLKKPHEDDFKLIENLCKDCDKTSKVAHDLRVSNADLVKTLVVKNNKFKILRRLYPNEAKP
jgi:aspartyl/asparaginyl-tRNA synthetase